MFAPCRCALLYRFGFLSHFEKALFVYFACVYSLPFQASLPLTLTCAKLACCFACRRFIYLFIKELPFIYAQALKASSFS